MRIHRPDSRKVVPTAEELAQWQGKHPSRSASSRPERVEHECGLRMWYSGLGVMSHIKACPGAPTVKY